MINFPTGWTDYACNTQGSMTAFQLIQRDSAENAESFIAQFEQAIRNGMDPNDQALQSQIFNSGSLRYDELLPADQEYVIKRVEAIYEQHNRRYY